MNELVSKQEEASVQIQLEAINLQEITIPVVGTTPLLMDKMPEATIIGILEKQTGISKGNKKAKRDIHKEVGEAVHVTNRGQVGFPASGFKRGMMEATSFVGDKMFSKKLVSGSVRIINSEDGLIPIIFKKRDTLKHVIGHNMKFTPQFHGWSCELRILYDANNISAQDIVTLVNYAGFYSGIGAWRPKCRDGGSGEYGAYSVQLGKKSSTPKSKTKTRK